MEAIAARYTPEDPTVQTLSPEQIEREFRGYQDEVAQIKSHNWVYGQVPRFKYKLESGADTFFVFRTKKGMVIESIEIEHADQSLEVIDSRTTQLLTRLNQELKGMPFDGRTIANSILSLVEANDARELSTRLQKLAKDFAENVPKQHWVA